MGIKDRLELESRVLAAALKQSFERGDTTGVSLAHRQIFLLLRAAQEVKDDSTNSGAAPVLSAGRSAADRTNARLPAKGIKVKTRKGKKRVMPDIVWTEDEEGDEDSDEAGHKNNGSIEESGDSQEPAPRPDNAVSAPAADSAGLLDSESTPDSSGEREPSGPSIKPVPASYVKQQNPAASLIPLSEALSSIGAGEQQIVDDQSSETRTPLNDVPQSVASGGDDSHVETLPPTTRSHAQRELEGDDVSTEEMKATELLESLRATGDRIKQISSDETVESEERPEFDAYDILHVEQIATFEEIHRNFLYLVRKLMFALKKVKRKQRKLLLAELQDLWIAHDILSDPVTRTDYDFRILGLRGAPDVIIHTAPEDREQAQSSTRTPLRIGELMQCAGLLEPTELEIAADMHKAMPEMLFGAFLVKQGFIEEADLDQVLMGQRLLKNGNITVGHFQMAMKNWREASVPIEETAVEEGLVSKPEMDRIIASGMLDTHSGIPAVGGMHPLRPIINAEEAAKRNLSAGHAVPSWKDQLDWSAPDPVPKHEEHFDERPKSFEPPPEIEGITPDPARKKSGKKTLRVLIEGISDGEVNRSIFDFGGNDPPANPTGDTGEVALLLDAPSSLVTSGAAESALSDQPAGAATAYGEQVVAVEEPAGEAGDVRDSREEPRERSDTGPLTMDPGFDVNNLSSLPRPDQGQPQDAASLDQVQSQQVDSQVQEESRIDDLNQVQNQPSSEEESEPEEFTLDSFDDDDDEELRDIDYFGAGDEIEDSEQSGKPSEAGTEFGASSGHSTHRSDGADSRRRSDTVTGARLDSFTADTQPDSSPDQSDLIQTTGNRVKPGELEIVYRLENEPAAEDDDKQNPTASS